VLPRRCDRTAPYIPLVAPAIAAGRPGAIDAATFAGMKEVLMRAAALAAVFLLPLFSTTFAAQAALPRQAACPADSSGVGAPPRSATDLACLGGIDRAESPARSTLPALILPLARERQLQSALQHWKALEAEALTVPKQERPDALAAYLHGRQIETSRSDALKDTAAAIVQAEARILQLGVDFRAATHLATRWIHRQPGRGVPAAYLERIVTAADAILSEDMALQARYRERDALNRHFDEQLEQVLTRAG
jgi:hypothetical protein